MTQQEAVHEWRHRARSQISIARDLAKTDDKEYYIQALFHCHLGLELGMKARYMETNAEEAPYTHDIADLAVLLRDDWNTEELDEFDKLSDFAILARYADTKWLEEEAKKEKVDQWIIRVDHFLTLIFS